MAQYRNLTAQQIRRRVLTLTHRESYTFGTVLAAPAPSTQQFALREARKFPDNSFEGKIAYVVAGTGIGQSSYVSESTSGTGLITVVPSLVTLLDTTSVVEIIPDGITPEAFIEDVNTAIESIMDMVGVYVETPAPVIPDAERLTVQVPATYSKLCGFQYKNAGGFWVPFRAASTQQTAVLEQGRGFYYARGVIHLTEAIPSDIPNTDIVISGYRFPTIVDTDDDLVEAPSAYVIFKTAALLEQALIAGSENDPDSHMSRSATWQTQAEAERTKGPFTNWMPDAIPLLV